MPTVKVNDINIYYETYGEGEPLVLIIGYGSNSLGWFRQIPHLSQEYQVVTFDNRGTGRSDKPDIPYTMEIMAGDIAGLLEATDIDATHIFGISMGGMIAQEFALSYPKKTSSLILGCTNCGGSHSITPDAEVMNSLFDFQRAQQLTPEEVLRQTVPFLFSQQFIDNNPDIVEQWITNMAKYPTPVHGYMRQAGAMMGHDTYERLPGIKIPTLVIAGDADKMVPVENSRLLASRIPNAELIILENAGHSFITEAEEKASTAVLDFLRRHRRSG